MNPLAPQPPFVWPEARVLEGMRDYENQPPFGELGFASRSLFGIVTAPTAHGIHVLETWLKRNSDLNARLIVMVYPACATKQRDLTRLAELIARFPGRLSVHVFPLEKVTDRGTNALCFLGQTTDATYLVIGPSESLGLVDRQIGQANFAFGGDPVLINTFRRYFDWHWGHSRAITDEGVASIPHLVLPEGTLEAAQAWQAYRDRCAPAKAEKEDEQEEAKETPDLVVKVNQETGEVTTRNAAGEEVESPTEELGVEKLDQLAERVARLYAEGILVSIEKLSRIPPLDAPLDPRWFGDPAELQAGGVTRKISMRVSAVDEKTLKEIDKRRQGLRALLSKFTFALADNMRWMPVGARELFESEVQRINEEGQKLISDLVKGDVKAFIEGRREALKADIDRMYEQLGRRGEVTEEVINLVIQSLQKRFQKAQGESFMPKLSYSVVRFAVTKNDYASPWGQAFSLLADVAAFPRKVYTDGFFLRGLQVSEDRLVRAMNVADDALLREPLGWNLKERCKMELELLSDIAQAEIGAKDRCELVWMILEGHPVQEISDALKPKESP